MSAWTEARDRQMIADGWVRRPDGYWEQPKVKLGPNYGTAKPDLVLDNGTKVHMPPPKLPKRIRQSSKPLMNKLETEWYEQLKFLYANTTIHIQAKRYKLANGIWYKPDFTVCADGGHFSGEVAWEVKGPKAWRGGFENLKVVAHQWPQVQFLLVWKDKQGQWQQQEVLP